MLRQLALPGAKTIVGGGGCRGRVRGELSLTTPCKFHVTALCRRLHLRTCHRLERVRLEHVDASNAYRCRDRGERGKSDSDGLALLARRFALNPDPHS